MLNKEKIEKAKEEIQNKLKIIPKEKGGMCFITNIALETFLQYNNQLEQENNKQNKIINEMAKYMSENMECDFIVSTNEKCENTDCKDCFRLHFEKKAEED